VVDFHNGNLTSRKALARDGGNDLADREITGPSPGEYGQRNGTGMRGSFCERPGGSWG